MQSRLHSSFLFGVRTLSYQKSVIGKRELSILSNRKNGARSMAPTRVPTEKHNGKSIPAYQGHLRLGGISQSQDRNHYTSSSPGEFHHQHPHSRQERDFFHRGFTVGIGGPVGSGKTALVLELTRWLKDGWKKTSETDQTLPPVGVVTNDIFTQEDAEFLMRQDALPHHLIRAVETGGCPHAAIREDVSANLSASEDLTEVLIREQEKQSSISKVHAPLILCESGGDNLAANFSHELADLTIYVICVAGGEKVPRKGGPGITQSDLLIINKIDLAEQVGADLGVMERDANKMRRIRGSTDEGSDSVKCGPTIFASVKHGVSVPDIQKFILDEYYHATRRGQSQQERSQA